MRSLPFLALSLLREHADPGFDCNRADIRRTLSEHFDEALARARNEDRPLRAHFAAFEPEGAYFAESEVDADRQGAFEFLVGLLRDRPEFNAMTPEEEQAAAGGKR
jgi:hypothetical protein